MRKLIQYTITQDELNSMQIAIKALEMISEKYSCALDCEVCKQTNDHFKYHPNKAIAARVLQDKNILNIAGFKL